MPLFTVELNRLADDIGASDLTIYLHTAAPSDADNDAGRITAASGGNYDGATLAAANISAASNGDISNSAAISFGTANANVGTVTHWSAFRGSAAVAFGTLTSTTINSGDTFQIAAGALQINGSTS